jgi:hypothetical protein
MALRYRYLIEDGSLQHVGVPAHDLTDEDMSALTEEQRKLVASSALYEQVGKIAAKTATEGDDE